MCTCIQPTMFHFPASLGVVMNSCTTDELIVPAVRLTSIGSRAFPVAGARIWNTLPLHVTSASSLTVFKQNLKLHLLNFSFPCLSPV